MQHLDTIHECKCHRWVLRDWGMYEPRPCKRCGRVPKFVRMARPEDKTECLHTGVCDPWKDTPSATSTGPGTA